MPKIRIPRGIRLATSLTLAVCLGDLVSTISHLPAAVYSSSASIYAQLQNGPIRLYFPFLVSLVAGLALIGDLENRFAANTRSRIGIQKRLLREAVRVSAWAFGIFGSVALIKVFIAFLVIPRLMPQVINPHSYASTEEAIQTLNEIQSPIAGTLRTGLPLFAVTAAIWNGIVASAFALLTLICVVLVRNRVLALLLPAIFYIAESIFTQLVDLPGLSYLLSATYPTGLQNYPLWQAILAIATVTLFSGAVFAWIIKTASKNQRFA